MSAQTDLDIAFDTLLRKLKDYVREEIKSQIAEQGQDTHLQTDQTLLQKLSQQSQNSSFPASLTHSNPPSGVSSARSLLERIASQKGLVSKKSDY